MCIVSATVFGIPLSLVNRNADADADANESICIFVVQSCGVVIIQIDRHNNVIYSIIGMT